MLSDIGLQVVGCHINPLKLERLPAVLDYQAEIGNTQIGCDIEFYPLGDRDYVLRRADFFNEVGRLCADREMRFYYHNHFQEFQFHGGETVYQRAGQHRPRTGLRGNGHLLGIPGRAGSAGMDAPLRRPDSAAAPKGLPGAGLAAAVAVRRNRRHRRPDHHGVLQGGRDPDCFTEIGTGVLPIQDIIDTAGTLPNLQYMFLEQDYSRLPDLDSIARSRDAFSNFTGISWE